MIVLYLLSFLACVYSHDLADPPRSPYPRVTHPHSAGSADLHLHLYLSYPSDSSDPAPAFLTGPSPRSVQNERKQNGRDKLDRSGSGTRKSKNRSKSGVVRVLENEKINTEVRGRRRRPEISERFDGSNSHTKDRLQVDGRSNGGKSNPVPNRASFEQHLGGRKSDLPIKGRSQSDRGFESGKRNSPKRGRFTNDKRLEGGKSFRGGSVNDRRLESNIRISYNMERGFDSKNQPFERYNKYNEHNQRSHRKEDKRDRKYDNRYEVGKNGRKSNGKYDVIIDTTRQDRKTSHPKNKRKRINRNKNLDENNRRNNRESQSINYLKSDFEQKSFGNNRDRQRLENYLYDGKKKKNSRDAQIGKNNPAETIHFVQANFNDGLNSHGNKNWGVDHKDLPISYQGRNDRMHGRGYVNEERSSNNPKVYTLDHIDKERFGKNPRVHTLDYINKERFHNNERVHTLDHIEKERFDNDARLHTLDYINKERLYNNDKVHTFDHINEEKFDYNNYPFKDTKRYSIPNVDRFIPFDSNDYNRGLNRIEYLYNPFNPYLIHHHGDFSSPGVQHPNINNFNPYLFYSNAYLYPLSGHFGYPINKNPKFLMSNSPFHIRQTQPVPVNQDMYKQNIYSQNQANLFSETNQQKQHALPGSLNPEPQNNYYVASSFDSMRGPMHKNQIESQSSNKMGYGSQQPVPWNYEKAGPSQDSYVSPSNPEQGQHMDQNLKNQNNYGDAQTSVPSKSVIAKQLTDKNSDFYKMREAKRRIKQQRKTQFVSQPKQNKRLENIKGKNNEGNNNDNDNRKGEKIFVDSFGDTKNDLMDRNINIKSSVETAKDNSKQNTEVIEEINKNSFETRQLDEGEEIAKHKDENQTQKPLSAIEKDPQNIENDSNNQKLTAGLPPACSGLTLTPSQRSHSPGRLALICRLQKRLGRTIPTK